MEKKQILVGGVMGGILIAFVPSMWIKDGILPIVFNVVGMLLLGGAVLYFILPQGGITGSSKKYPKEINAKIKAGIITPEDAHEEYKKMLQQELEITKQKLELEKQKALIQKEKDKSKPKPQPGQEQKSKMPDVLGNLGPLMGGGQSEQQKKKDEDLKNLF